MSNYTAVNILDMIDSIGEDKVNRILSDFSCPKNDEIEAFVKKNALDFAKKKMSVTHLVVNEQGELAAIYTLAHKAVEISDAGLSSSIRRKLRRYAQLDEKSKSYTVSAFLIAQFGKNYSLERIDLNGVRLMEKAFETLSKVQREVGGGVAYLECENKPKLLSFYENDYNRFRVFGERYSGTDSVQYIQLLRLF